MSDAVVLLHGFAGFPGVMHPFAQAMRKQGYRTLAPWYDSWRWPLHRIVDHLTPKITAFEQVSQPGDRLHFIGHSMGGLLALALIARSRPERLGNVVMLGTPNQGSELADLLHSWSATRGILGRAAPALLTTRLPDWEVQLGQVDYPLGIIAGDRPMIRGISDLVMPRPHDGKVSVSSTHVDGEADHIVLPLSHMMLAYHTTAHAQASAFLAKAAFDRPLD